MAQGAKRKMLTEHATVKMGLDKTAFDSGLAGARTALHTFEGTLAALGVHFSLGHAKEFIHSLFEMGESLKSQAERLGVSTDFLQVLSYGAEQTGANAEVAAKALDKFARSADETGEGSADIEGRIRKLADEMAKQPDPVKRAQLAHEAF